jgi:hypothetical protein
VECLKRLCTAKYGTYALDVPTPVAGEVHVYGVGRDGCVAKYAKGRDQVRTPSRPDLGQVPSTTEVGTRVYGTRRTSAFCDYLRIE